jgi:HlyD family secretion protein
MKRPSVSRTLLPILAGVALLVAIVIVLRTQPDRQTTTPANTPPTVPANQLRTGAVSGAGVVEPSSELIEVGAQRPGVVRQVAVQAGDRVSRGQLLFRIDDRDARAAVREAQAAVDLGRRRVASARVDLAAAERLLGLYESVEDPRAVAEQEVIDRRAQRDRAAAALAVARAELGQAEARLASARTDLALHEVRSPRAGEVLQVRVRPGEYATAGPAPGNNSEPLMTIGETQPLHVRIDIDESEIDRVAIGEPAIVSPRGNAGRRVEAAYVRTEPLIVPKRSLTNQATERVDVRVLQLIYALPPTARDFYVGQQVDAFIPAKARPAATQTAAAR